MRYSLSAGADIFQAATKLLRADQIKPPKKRRVPIKTECSGNAVTLAAVLLMELTESDAACVIGARTKAERAARARVEKEVIFMIWGYREG
jgi:hypothetical protein